MINSSEYFGNTFTDELYHTIYTGILKSHQGETDQTDNIVEQLESPQKEQFVSLFIELKTKNYPLDTNFVLRLCHKLLVQKKSNVSFQRNNKIIGLNEISHHNFRQKQFKDEKPDKNETESSYGLFEKKNNDRFSLGSNRMNLLTDARIKFGRELLLNLTQYDQGMKWVKSDKDIASIIIPNLEFVVKNVYELGRLHKVIKDYVNTAEEHNGCVVKALIFGLQEKINSYYVYVNKWLHANLDVLEHSKDDCLRICIPLDHNILMVFQCLAKVVKNAKGKNGCNLISSVIHSSIREFENQMFNEITKPIQTMIFRWMIDGEIKDEYGEFFIVENSSEIYWNKSHALSSTNTLNFLNKNQLNDIYQTGKNMNLLLKMLNPKINTKIEKLRENIKILAANGDGLIIMLTDKCSKISTIISNTCDQSSALLMEVLIDDYNLFQHFEGFRNYMLFGRGDFYTYIIHELEPYFGNDEIYKYQLKDIIKKAYTLTSAGNDSKELFDNLKYRIDTTGKVNWNSIMFEYKTDEPLNQIFGSCYSHYANVFRFLWRLKNVDWTTHKMWHELNYFVKKSFNMIELKPVLRNINSLLASMLSCVNEIQNFVFEMIDDEWEQFKSETHRATCIETVTDAHMSFLESITRCMDDGSVSLDAYVKSLKIHIERFSNVFRCFVYATESSSSEDSKTGKYDKREENMINDFMDDFGDVLKKQYETELGDFLIKLKDSKTRGLGTLALRIDFNGYYSSNNASFRH